MNFKKSLGVFVFVIICALLFPKNVYASAIDDVLTGGKLVIPSIPQTGNMAYDTSAVYLSETLESNVYVVYDSWNSDYTKCKLSDGENEREVSVVWQYDKNVKKIVDSIVSKYPSDVVEYVVDDYEIMNLNINGGGLANNSTEFRKNIGYKNFYLDVRGGGGPDLTTSAIGMLKFNVDGTLYWIGPNTRFVGQYVLYVSEDTDDIASALEERLSKLFIGHTFDVSEIDGSSTTQIVNDYIADATDRYNNYSGLQDDYPTLEDFLATQNDYDFLDGAEEKLYDVGIDEAFGFEVAVKKDSSKAVDSVDFITNDVLTNISISATDNAVLPLDTMIQVKKMTSGSEYDKIINLLGVSNSETYDLKLYSKGSRGYITALDDGSFVVKIPVSASLKDKDLMVYYVDGDDKVHEYKVKYETINNEVFAVFTTDHFSVYTLAEVPSDSSVLPPKTGDKIIFSLLLFVIGGLGFRYVVRRLRNE